MLHVAQYNESKHIMSLNWLGIKAMSKLHLCDVVQAISELNPSDAFEFPSGIYCNSHPYYTYLVELLTCVTLYIKLEDIKAKHTHTI